MNKVRATQTQIVDVELSDHSLDEASIKSFRNRVMPKDLIRTEAYINQEGVWEQWDSGRGGSGYTETFRKATESEKDIMKIFSDWKNLGAQMRAYVAGTSK